MKEKFNRSILKPFTDRIEELNKENKALKKQVEGLKGIIRILHLEQHGLNEITRETFKMDANLWNIYEQALKEDEYK